MGEKRSAAPTTLGAGSTPGAGTLIAATKSRQVPWSNSSLLGEVYLAEK